MTNLPVLKIRSVNLGYFIFRTIPENTSGSYLLSMPARWASWLNYSNFIRKPTSWEATTFWTVKSEKVMFFWRIFLIIFVYYLIAFWLISTVLAPRQMILPDLKTKAVVLGSLMRMMTAEKRLGL